MHLLEDVGHGGGVQMAGVEEVEDMTGVKGMKNDVRKDNESIPTMPVK